MTGAELRRRVTAPVTDKAGRFAPFKAAVLVLVLLPGVLMLARLFGGELGGNAYLALTRDTGIWAIRLIMVTLAITPLRRILQWPRLVTVRRMIGVTALVYTIVHLLVYAADRAFDLAVIGHEIVGASLLVGTIALIAMVPLGITSTDAMVRRLGGNWRTLHRLVYAVAVLAVAHYYLLLAKLGTTEATIEAGLFVLMMAYRAAYAARGHRGVPLSVLAVLSVACGFAAMVIEATYFGLATNINGRLVWGANFSLDVGLRPGWVVMLIGLAVTAAGYARAWQQRAPAIATVPAGADLPQPDDYGRKLREFRNRLVRQLPDIKAGRAIAARAAFGAARVDLEFDGIAVHVALDGAGNAVGGRLSPLGLDGRYVGMDETLAAADAAAILHSYRDKTAA